MNNYPHQSLSNNIIELPYNCEVLFQKDLDIIVKINSVNQSHPITFSCLLPKGTNQKRIKVLFTSKDDLFFLYAMEQEFFKIIFSVDEEVIIELNTNFGVKLQNLNDFLSMFNDLLLEVQKKTKKASLTYSNQNSLTLSINSVINGKQFLILRLNAEKQPADIIQAWTAFKYGQLKDNIMKRQNKIVQLRELVRVKNPYILNYIDKIQ